MISMTVDTAIQSVDEPLADVRGGAGASKPTSFFVFKNPSPLNNIFGKDIGAEQRQRNDLLKQKLKDERWIRHKDTPHWERDETTGFASPI
jgi:hypothetical protein